MLYPYYEIEKESEPLEVDLGKHGKCHVYELYCTNPRCGCWDAYLAFVKPGDRKPAFDFQLSLRDFKINPKAKSRDKAEENLEMAEAFISNLTDAQKNLLVTHYRKAKEYGRENPFTYVDILNFEFGPMFPYNDFFESSGGEPLNFVYGNRWYHIEDLYCVTPSCNCESVILCIYEVEQGEDVQGSLFDILVSFNKRFEIKRKRRDLSKRQVKRFFKEVIKGDEELFRTLKTRYIKMKRFGAQILARRIEELGKQGKKIGKNTLCPCGSGKKYKFCCISAVESVGS